MNQQFIALSSGESYARENKFKEEAIKLSMKIASYRCKLLKPEAPFYNWLDKVKITSFAGSDPDCLIGSKALLKENKCLDKALVQAQEKAALLKNAAAYFLSTSNKVCFDIK
jgi:hypothetical protein